MKSFKELRIEATGYSQKAALGMLFDQGLLNDANAQKIASTMPMSKDGYISANDLKKFSKTIKKTKAG